MNPAEEVTHAHLFCGLGGGALGFQRMHASVGTLTARPRCLGGIDSDPAAIAASIETAPSWATA